MWRIGQFTSLISLSILFWFGKSRDIQKKNINTPSTNHSSMSTSSSLDPGFASTGFLLWGSAFVFLMTPGVGLLYSGMSRSKNALSLIMISFLSLCIITIQVIYFYIHTHYLVGDVWLFINILRTRFLFTHDWEF